MKSNPANYYIKCKYDKIKVLEETISTVRNSPDILALYIDVEGERIFLSSDVMKLFERVKK